MNYDYNAFFEALAERKAKENDLSDITYALLKYSKDFRAFFIHEFFPSLAIDKIKDIRREKAVEGDRPDFWIETDDSPYLIEVKIDDRGHHFAQYCSRIVAATKSSSFGMKEAASHLGYITNYTVRPEDLSESDREVFEDCASSCKQWTELIANMESYPWAKDDALVRGFIHYAQKLCMPLESDPGWRFSTTQFDRVFTFHRWMLNAVEALKDQGVLHYSSTYEHCPEGKKGVYLQLDVADSDGGSRPQYPFVGVYFGNDDAKPDESGTATCQFCIGFERAPHWGDVVCAKTLHEFQSGISDEHEGLFFYPQRCPNSPQEMIDLIRIVLLAACQNQDKIEITDSLRDSIGGNGKFAQLADFRSIRNLTRTLNKSFIALGLDTHSRESTETIKHDPYRVGEWCSWDAEGKKLYMWIGVVGCENGKSEFVCEIDTAWNRCETPQQPLWIPVEKTLHRTILHTGDGSTLTLQQEIERAKREVEHLIHLCQGENK